MQYAEGSYANGGVMRIAPVGLAFRNADVKVLHAAVVSALLCTHIHPEAIDGAFLQAYAVAQLCKISDPTTVDFVALVTKLKDLSATDIIKGKLTKILDFHANNVTDDMKVVLDLCEANMFGRQFQIRSSEAIACALWALLRYGKNPEQCLIKTVGFGGDADTVGAICGALLGALYGTAWIPKRWFDNIEDNTWQGKKFIIESATKLALLDLQVCDNDIWDLNHSRVKACLSYIDSQLPQLKPEDIQSFARDVHQRLRNPTTKAVLSVSANAAWSKLLHNFKFINEWTSFVERKKVRDVSADKWNMVIDFFFAHPDNISNYSEIEITKNWGVISDFVKNKKEKEQMWNSTSETKE